MATRTPCAATCATSGTTGAARISRSRSRKLDTLVEHYAQRGAFVASINWYRAGSGGVAMSLAEQVPAPQDRIPHPTRVLWPEHDPLFPRGWGDRLDEFFTDITVTDMPRTGHFSPLEAPETFAAAVRELSASTKA